MSICIWYLILPPYTLKLWQDEHLIAIGMHFLVNERDSKCIDTCRIYLILATGQQEEGSDFVLLICCLDLDISVHTTKLCIEGSKQNVWYYLHYREFDYIPVNTLDQLYEVSKESQKKRQSLVKSKIAGGESVIAVNKNVLSLPIQSNFNPLYCAYCGKQCNSQKQWDEHCASERHNFNVSSDKEHQWNHRQPPWGVPGSSYELCVK